MAEGPCTHFFETEQLYLAGTIEVIEKALLLTTYTSFNPTCTAVSSFLDLFCGKGIIKLLQSQNCF